MFVQQFFDSRDAISEALAERIAGQLSRAIAHRGSASLVVSGGSSPLAVFKRLSSYTLDWRQVTILPSDERWVDDNDPASNAAMIRRELLQGPAAEARFVSLFDDQVDYEQADKIMSDRISAVQRPFDYVLLGMGTDGHTASLFPDAPDIEQSLSARQACVLAAPPSQSQRRISLTPSALLDAYQIGILFFGQEKADVFAAASSDGDLREYPIRSVLRQQRVPVTTYFAL
ncbi:MAG: 6-phosphogluconolactonase [Pseudomonadota bacterium]